MGMGKTQPTEKLKEPEKRVWGRGGCHREEVRKGETLRKIIGFLTWADGLLCDIGNTRWIFYKLQLVAMS